MEPGNAIPELEKSGAEAYHPRLLELVPSIARLAPAAVVVGKHVYSAFVEPGSGAGIADPPSRYAGDHPGRKRMFASWRHS